MSRVLDTEVPPQGVREGRELKPEANIKLISQKCIKTYLGTLNKPGGIINFTEN